MVNSCFIPRILHVSRKNAEVIFLPWSLISFAPAPCLAINCVAMRKRILALSSGGL